MDTKLRRMYVCNFLFFFFFRREERGSPLSAPLCLLAEEGRENEGVGELKSKNFETRGRIFFFLSLLRDETLSLVKITIVGAKYDRGFSFYCGYLSLRLV